MRTNIFKVLRWRPEMMKNKIKTLMYDSKIKTLAEMKMQERHNSLCPV